MRKVEGMKKILSLLLCVVLVLGMLPLSARAEGETQEHQHTMLTAYSASETEGKHLATVTCETCSELNETTEEDHTFTDGACVCGAEEQKEEKETEKLLYPGCAHHNHDADCGGLLNNCCYVCDTCVAEIQAMVDALPAMNEINDGNKAQVGEALKAIQQRYVLLSDAAMGKINFTKFDQAALALNTPENHFRFAMQKRYEAGVDGPQATLTFINTATNTPASLIPVDSAVAVTSIQPISNGTAQEFYLPAGTYTVVETVDGEWNMTMTVNGVEDDDHTFTAEAGDFIELAAMNEREQNVMYGDSKENADTTGNLEEVFARAQEGANIRYIKLIQDVEITNGLNFTGNATLDLNGHSIVAGNDTAIYTTGSTCDLTLTDSSQEGKGTVVSNSSYAISNNGKLTIAGGEFTSSKNHAIYNGENGQLTISGSPAFTPGDGYQTLYNCGAVNLAGLDEGILKSFWIRAGVDAELNVLTLPNGWAARQQIFGDSSVYYAKPKKFIGGKTYALGKLFNITDKTQVDHGTVYMPESACYRETVTIKVTPDPGYDVKQMDAKINGNTLTPSTHTVNGGEGTYIFNMVSGDVEFFVTYKAKTYNVTTIVGDGGTITVDETAAFGSQVQMEVTPESYYELGEFTVKDASGAPITVTESNGEYTFTMPASDVTIEAAFEGTITWPTVGEITYGQTLADCTLTGGSVSDPNNDNAVAGTFAFKDADTVPTVVDDSQTTEYALVFTPADTVNYETVEKMVKVTVKPKEVAINWSDVVLTYDGTYQKPTATATGLVNATDVCTITVEGEQTEAGTYTATAVSLSNNNYKLPSNVTKEFTIKNAAQTMPELIVNDESIFGKADGTIQGLTTAMEFATEENAADSEYTKIENVDMTFAAGTYYIRLAAKTNFDASAAKKVVIAAGRKLDVTLPSSQTGYTLTMEGDDEGKVGYNGSVTLTFTKAPGYTCDEDDFAVTVLPATVTVTDNHDGTYTLSNITEDTRVSVAGVSDITAPEVTITVKDNVWKEFLDRITFGKYFNATQTVTIEAADAGSGVDKVYYYLSAEALSLEQVKALEASDWTEYEEAFAISPDNKYVVYAKAVDKAANTTHISSNGMILDKTNPVITGVDNNGVYYTTQKVTASDNTTLDTLKLNGNSFDGTIPGNPNAEISYTIEAKDMAGNTTKFTITMKPISELSEPIDDITTDNVNSDDRQTVQDVLEDVGDVDSTDATEEEKAALEEIQDKAQDLKDVIEEIAEEIDRIEEELEAYDKDSVEIDDQEDLEELAKDIQDLLDGNNLTEEERDTLEEGLEKVEALMDMIKDATDVIGLIDKLPKPTEVEPDDKNAIDKYDQAKDAYDNLPDDVKDLIDEEAKKKLEEVGKALVSYDVTHQGEQSYVKGSGKTITFTANGYYGELDSYAPGAYGKFVSVEVDGKVVDAKHYSAKAGSTIITLNTNYLDSLSVGEHTFKINYIDGSTDGKDVFRVVVNNSTTDNGSSNNSSTNTGSPETGDNSQGMLFGGVAIFSLLCMALLVLFFPRKKGKYQH